MTKTICDRCQKEMKDMKKSHILFSSTGGFIATYDLCNLCAEAVRLFLTRPQEEQK